MSGAQRNFISDSAFAALLPVGEGAARRSHNFERAGDAGGVARVERGRRDRIERCQRGVIVADARGADCSSDGGVDRRDGGDAVEQGAQVEAGAADEDWQAARRVEVGDFGLGEAGPFGGGAGIGATASII